ncbi:MAG TPA: hypothetical protein VFZ97_13785 [Acidimicrobiales bacterium]
MPLLGRLGIGQRVVLVVSLALALLAVGVYVSTLGLSGNRIYGTGGIEYGSFLSPSQPSSPPTSWNVGILGSRVGPDLSGWQQLLVWVGLILVWAALSVALLRIPHRPDVGAETG